MMDYERLNELLSQLENGQSSKEEIAREIKSLSLFRESNHNLDFHRELRTGFSEVVFCQGKPDHTLESIFADILEREDSIIATRASEDQFKMLNGVFGNLEYDPHGRIIFKRKRDLKVINGSIMVITAGSADYDVAEEAALTAELLGCKVTKSYDNGVAGVHRLIDRMDEISSSSVIIAVAGMEGALPSVLAGLTDSPVIAVPTSIGYGASFGGVASLLAMLNSCGSGVSVVNIDNGFGAAMMAAKILKKTVGYAK